MSVGDVNSTARGSGARYNDGKPDMSLIPVDVIARSLFTHSSVPSKSMGHAMIELGKFQRSGAVAHLDMAINYVRGYWVDCARVFEYGRRKYSAWNWAKGMAWSIPIACAGRHAFKALYLEELDDDESGEDHGGHFLANLVMLRVFVETYPEGNDLPSPELFNPPAKEPDHVFPIC